jgi:hypothetical protein
MKFAPRGGKISPPTSAAVQTQLRSHPMTEERKYAILFSATILAARKLAEIGDKPCPAREACIADAIRNAESILKKIDERWPR